MTEKNLNSDTVPMFGTEKLSIAQIWDQMQRLQTDFALAQELTYYYTSAQWLKAKTVLDLGTGNGYYLGKIAQRFPDKVYHGVDISPEFIDIALREAATANISFALGSLFDVTEPSDFVLMRLVLQHMDDIPAILDQAARLTNPGGSALIIDAYDPFRFFHPELPEFMEFFSTYAEHERMAGRDRRVAYRVEQALASNPFWRPGSTLQLLIPSTIEGNLNLFAKTYTLLADLVEQSGKFQYNFRAVKDAWRRWTERTDAYTQVGLILIGIDRIC